MLLVDRLIYDWRSRSHYAPINNLFLNGPLMPEKPPTDMSRHPTGLVIRLIGSCPEFWTGFPLDHSTAELHSLGCDVWQWRRFSLLLAFGSGWAVTGTLVHSLPESFAVFGGHVRAARFRTTPSGGAA